ncbi:dipeptide ABC transporter ATP-binding protein [Actinoplanes sp. TRM 88003]|uniref:Dipeptide ABC transporter ATP-binding protein n=1 Tax=Paractinoplanes aksuensis TaxID=2939490 RepID=A0ABT1DT93_9ACTN|nr:dipeptide ABC transporter ATP-binding protein [Actinoplanes aksuensis]MCO8274058.1 dipeptide ABC transporter ATP-binding protein [Actinoplanes aksuensis]
MLQIEDLSVVIHRPGRQVAALSNVSFSVAPGEVVGLVGESGGGKSMVARAIVGMLPSGSHATGRVGFDGDDVLRMDAAALAHHRGRGAAMCFQNPRGALSPTRTVGRQLIDRLVTHQDMDGKRAAESAKELFAAVGIRNPSRRLEAYPHELSGGMAQRVMISLATGCAPGLLIADEPTTGLDVTLTREILRQFRHAADTDGRGVLLISHDLASIAEVCDRVVVLYAGTVVETGPAAQVLRHPAHPYTRALLRSVPDVSGGRAVATAGGMPLMTAAPHNCPFAPRCAHATDVCRETRPETKALSSGWSLACFHPQEEPLFADTVPSNHAESSGHAEPGRSAEAGRVVLRVQDAHVVYRSRFGSGGHHALRGVSLEIKAGETLGVVGESGCGKSTLAKLIMGLVEPSEGSVEVAGKSVRKQSRVERTRAQMVFQDPIGSLSPRRTVADSIAEPLRAAKVSTAERTKKTEAALQRMELDSSILTRMPHELSGGQAQRIGIARALVGQPDLIVFDEPTSALDVTVQAQILDVIADVAADAGHGSVFISHDLATVRGFADRVVVLYLGRVVEEGPVDEVFDNPQHPYTRALLGSAPRLGETRTADVELVKDLDEADAATGCALAARCPFVTDTCRSQEQTLQPYGESRAACWRIPELPALIGKSSS